MARRDHLKAIGDELSLNAEQRDRISKIQAEYQRKTEEPEAQLKQLCQEERKAFDGILNEQQRAKLQELHKNSIRSEDERR
jgi:hypothetical protein